MKPSLSAARIVAGYMAPDCAVSVWLHSRDQHELDNVRYLRAQYLEVHPSLVDLSDDAALAWVAHTFARQIGGAK